LSKLIKAALRSVTRNKVEFLALTLLIAFSLSLYITASITFVSADKLFSNYLRESYGDILIVGYIPQEFDTVVNSLSWIKDHTGFAVVPAYGIIKGDSKELIPILLGYTEAAYRNNTLLGGFKAKGLRSGEALLLRQGALFLKPGMELMVYTTINPTGPPLNFNLTIIGYAEGGLPLPAGPVLFLSKTDGEKLVDSFGGYTVYSIILKNDSNIRKKAFMLETLVRKIGGYVGFTFISKEDLLFYPGQSIILESTNALKFMSLVSWFVATIIIIILSIVYIEKNVREIGTLEAIGAEKWSLAKYLTTVWGVKLYSGFILSIIIGYLVAVYALNTVLSHPRLVPLRNFLEIIVPLGDVFFMFALATATLFLSVTVSILALRKMRLIEALNFYGLRLHIKAESSLPFTIMLAFSELRSVVWRALAAMVILSLTTTLLTLPYSIGDSLGSVSTSKSFDVKVTFLIIPRISPPLNYALHLIENMNVKDLSLWFENLYGSVGMTTFLVKNDVKEPVYAYSCLKVFKGSCKDTFYRFIEGKWPSKNEVAISLLLSKSLNIKVGDKIMLIRIIKGKLYENKVRVSGIYDSTIFPPSVLLPRDMVPQVSKLKVFVIRALTNDPEAMAMKFQGKLISNGYAAISTTWKNYLNELRGSLRYISKSIKDTILNSFMVVVLGSLAFALSDASTRKKLLALLRTIGLTTTDYSLTILTRWYVLAVISVPLTMFAIWSLTNLGDRLLSRVYLIQYIYIPLWFLEILFILPLLIGAVTALYYRDLDYIDELKTT